MKIDVFAHVLPAKFYEKILDIEPSLPERYPFIKHPLLTDIEKRVSFIKEGYKQVISNVNINPEDYVNSEQAAQLCHFGNQELESLVEKYPEKFHSAIAMLPMNNIEESLKIIDEVSKSSNFSGIQLFTRVLGKSLADEGFYPVLEAAARLNVPILLHPIFDERKPDNNIVFSWEYELSQTMLELVEAKIFKRLPDIKIIVHHAGAMIPFFAERINHILPADLAEDFKKFYVDTALLGNPKALELTVEYFGVDKVLFGTDAPLGIAPAGATEAITEAIYQLPFTDEEKLRIFSKNAEIVLN